MGRGCLGTFVEWKKETLGGEMTGSGFPKGFTEE